MQVTLFEDEKEISRLEHESTKLVLRNKRLIQEVDRGIMFKGLLSIGLESLDSVSKGAERSMALLVVGLVLAVAGWFALDMSSSIGRIVVLVGSVFVIGFWFHKEHTLSFKSMREEITLDVSRLGEGKINAFVDAVMKAKIELLKK
jgi:hypothetical protein